MEGGEAEGGGEGAEEEEVVVLVGRGERPGRGNVVCVVRKVSKTNYMYCYFMVHGVSYIHRYRAIETTVQKLLF